MAVIVVFLIAIASSAALAAFMLRRASPSAVATTALVTAAGGTVAGLWLFVYLTDGLTYFGMRTGLLEYLLRITALAAVTVGPTAIASGMVLPALWAAWSDRNCHGDRGRRRPPTPARQLLRDGSQRRGGQRAPPGSPSLAAPPQSGQRRFHRPRHRHQCKCGTGAGRRTDHSR